MKKHIFLSLILFLVSIQGHAQKPCEINTHYEEFISVSKSVFNERSFLIKKIIEVPEKSCFSGLVNNNLQFMDYLLTNFSSNANYKNLLEFKDSIALKNGFFADLRNDSLFTAVMSELVSKTIDKKVAKDSLSMDQLLNVAVKYFSIQKITDEGYYSGKVCVGLNDIKKTESDRKPFVEAFAFSSILKHYQSEEYNMYDEFVKVITELYKVNLGLDKTEKLLRAQGAVFLLMRNNDNLKKMLKSEYEKRKAFLPFVLVGE